jgi:hypothetical protein
MISLPSYTIQPATTMSPQIPATLPPPADLHHPKNQETNYTVKQEVKEEKKVQKKSTETKQEDKYDGIG